MTEYFLYKQEVTRGSWTLKKTKGITGQILYVWDFVQSVPKKNNWYELWSQNRTELFIYSLFTNLQYSNIISIEPDLSK